MKLVSSWLVLLSLLVPLSSQAMNGVPGSSSTTLGGGGGGYGGGGYAPSYNDQNAVIVRRMEAQARAREAQAQARADAEAREFEQRQAREAEIARQREEARLRAVAKQKAITEQIMKDRAETQKQLKEFDKKAGKEARKSHRDHIRATNNIPIVQEARRLEHAVNKEANKAADKLNWNAVKEHLNDNVSDYVKDQIKNSRDMAANGVTLSREEGATPSHVRLIENLALDTVKSVNAFLGGVAGGVYDGFLTTAQVMEVVYNNPMLLANLSNNIMHTLTSADVLENGFEHLTDTLKESNRIFWSANPYEMGNAAGHLAADITSAMTIAEFLGPLAGPLLDESFAGTRRLGEMLQESIQGAPELAPAVNATNQMIENAREAVMRNYEQCKLVRDMYNAGIPQIAEVRDQMMAEGMSLEQIGTRVSQLRRELGQQMKNITPEEVQPFIYERNIKEWGDPLGPTVEQLRAGRPATAGNPPKPGRTWEEIIGTSTTTNPIVNAFFEGR